MVGLNGRSIDRERLHTAKNADEETKLCYLHFGNYRICWFAAQVLRELKDGLQNRRKWLCCNRGMGLCSRAVPTTAHFSQPA